MGKDKTPRLSQSNTITQYTTPRQQTHRITRQGDTGDTSPDTQEPSRADLMEAIRGSREALETQIAGVSIEVNLLRADLRKVSDKVTTAEDNITSLQTEVRHLKKQVSHLTNATETLADKAEESEGRARRSNLRLLGFPERAEGRAAEAFLEGWLTETVPQGELSTIFAIERAHRALTSPPPVGAPPRALIAKILNYRDRDTILRVAREKAPLKFENHNITIYPDYTQRVQEMRKSFLEVKQKLRAMEVKYMLLYPAKLRVIYKGQSHFFEKPEEVWQWLDMADQMPARPPTGGDLFQKIRPRRRRADRSSRPRNRQRGQPDTRFLVQEDGTISTAGPESVLVPDTNRDEQQDGPRSQADVIIPETEGTPPGGLPAD